MSDLRLEGKLREVAGVQLAVGFNRRQLPAFQRLTALIGGGKIGSRLHVEGSRPIRARGRRLG